jgi:hypothetical protein
MTLISETQCSVVMDKLEGYDHIPKININHMGLSCQAISGHRGCHGPGELQIFQEPPDGNSQRLGFLLAEGLTVMGELSQAQRGKPVKIRQQLKAGYQGLDHWNVQVPSGQVDIDWPITIHKQKPFHEP